MTCISDETLAGLLEGRLDSRTTQRVNVHLDTCATCRQLVAHLVRNRTIAARDPAADASTRTETTRAAEVEPRQVLGRYTVLERIGFGAMGVVYRALDPALDRVVALKVVRERVRTKRAQAALRNEGRALAQLSHPNIVPVFDVGVVEESVFVVMEHVEGRSLSRWLVDTQPSRAEVLNAFDQFAAGLDAMHRAGLVHRDVKSANALVRRDGRVMVSDFGLVHRLPPSLPSATARSDSTSDTTSLRSPVGTPAYMAPEVLCGAAPSVASDQFSFFVALFEALSGQRPFGGRNLADSYRRRVADDLPPLLDGQPDWLQRTIRTGLRSRPQDRHRSMANVRAALEPPRRHWSRFAGPGLALVGLSGFAFLASGTPSSAENCDGDLGARVWAPARRDAAHQVFGQIASAQADESFVAVDAALASYEERWNEQATQVCVATKGAATACLRGQRKHADASVDLLETIDASTLPYALAMVANLPKTERCLRRSEFVPDEAPAAVAEALARVAAHWQLQQFADAETEARIALRGALAANSLRAVRVARLELGRALMRQGKANDAIPLLEQAYWSASRHNAHVVAANAGLEISVFLADNAEIDAAEVWTRRSRTELDRLATPNLHMEGVFQAHVGALHWLFDELEEAELSFMLAEQFRVASGEDSAANLAVSINNRAAVLSSLRQDAAAIAEYERAIEILENAYGPNFPPIADNLNALGVSWNKRGQPKNAQVALERALQILRATADPGSAAIGRVLTNLGGAHEELGELDRARTRYEQAIQVLAVEGRPPHRDAFVPHLGLSALARFDGDYAAAKTWAHKAGALCERTLGEAHVCVGQVAYELNATASVAGEPAEALRQGQRAVSSWTTVLGPSHPLVAIALRSVGDALLELKRYEDAAQAYRRAIELAELDPDAVELGPMLSGLAETRLLQRQPDEAERLAREAVEARSSPLQRGTVELVLAKALHAGGKRRPALEVAQQAREHMLEFGPAAAIYVDQIDAWIDEVQPASGPGQRGNQP